MTGIAAIQARIGSIESLMGDVGVSSSLSNGAGGTSFDGLLAGLNAQAAASGGDSSSEGSQKFFGYVPAGTKLATVPGTQAFAQAQAAAAEAAAREEAARVAAAEAASRAAAEQAAARAAERAASSASGSSTAQAASAAPAQASSAAQAAPAAPAAAPAVSSAKAATAVAPATSGGLTGQQVVDTAKKYLGVPYKWGGQSRAGMDCSGLVQRTFLDHGIKLPRTARSLMKAGTEVPSLAQAQPGDLIITRGGGHVAIYMGDNKIIHAPYAGEVVKIQKNYSTDATIDTIRRIV